MESEEIQILAKLTQLKIEPSTADHVTETINNVLTLVDQLKAADLEGELPMAHPLDAVQRLRADKVTECNGREHFQALAPATEQGLYLVPQVIGN